VNEIIITAHMYISLYRSMLHIRIQSSFCTEWFTSAVS